MDAKQTSDLILSLVTKTNLNFSISEWPFSASIIIRKSVIKSETGNPFPSTNSWAEYDSVLETLVVAESEREAFASCLSIQLEKQKVEISRFLKFENEANEEVEGLKKERLENKTLKYDASSDSKTIEKGELEIQELQRKNKILSNNLKKLFLLHLEGRENKK